MEGAQEGAKPAGKSCWLSFTRTAACSCGDRSMRAAASWRQLMCGGLISRVPLGRHAAEAPRHCRPPPYLSSQTSSIRQPLKILLTMTVYPLT